MCTPSLFVAVLFASTAQAAVLFVDDDAPDGGDGQRWTTAFRDLQDALAVAEPGDEAWMAAGTYRPDRGTGDRMAAFQLAMPGSQISRPTGRAENRDAQTHRSVRAISR